MGLAFAVIWSSAFSSAKVIVSAAPALAALSVRFLIAGCIGVALARFLGQSWHLSRDQWRATLIFGFCQNALYLGLNFFAIQSIDASLAAIIASTMPLLVAFLGWVVLRDRLPALAIFGLVLGFLGVGIIMAAGLETGTADILSIALCLIGATALAVATLSMRRATSGGNMMMVVGLQMFVGAITLGIASLLTETFYFDPSPAFYIAFGYTVLVPGLLATFIWFALVARIGATRAASFHFLNPFFGVVLAALLLGEAFGWRDVLGVAVVTLGILAVQLSRDRPSSAVSAPRH